MANRQAIRPEITTHGFMTNTGKDASYAKRGWATKLKSIFKRIFAYFFGCVHHRTTWPQSNHAGFDYVCCLDCGKEFLYSWKQMRISTKEELLQERSLEPGKQAGRNSILAPMYSLLHSGGTYSQRDRRTL